MSSLASFLTPDWNSNDVNENDSVTRPHKQKRRTNRGRDCRIRRRKKAERFNRVHPQHLLVEAKVDGGAVGIHIKPKYSEMYPKPAYPKPPEFTALPRYERLDQPVVREQEAALEALQRVVRLINDQRSKVDGLERRMEVSIGGDGYDDIDGHELLVLQRQIFEMEDSVSTAVTAVTDGAWEKSSLDAVVKGLSEALQTAGEEEERIEGIQEAIDEASDGVARFRGFSGEAEYVVGKLKDDFAQVGELLAEAIEAVESVCEHVS